MMNKLSDLLAVGSVFNAINDVKPFPFLTGDNADSMDALLELNHGDALLFEKIKTKTMPELAKMIVLLYGDSWDRLIKFNTDLDSGLTGDRRVMTETTTTDNNSTNNADNKNLVSAYNDDDLMVNDGSLNVNTDVMSGTVEKVLNDETFNLWNSDKALSYGEKNAIIKTVISNVKSFLTINIY